MNKTESPDFFIGLVFALGFSALVVFSGFHLIKVATRKPAVSSYDFKKVPAAFAEIRVKK